MTIIVFIDSDGEMLRVWEDMSVKYAQDPRKDRYHEYIEVSNLYIFLQVIKICIIADRR